MDKHLEKLTSELGKGLVLPVAYDTAWLARVPSFPNITEPAFPNTITWLRENQLSNGSWGTERPVSAHGNILSTLAVILALIQWNNPDDNERIYRGIQSLNYFAGQLKNAYHETIGFELLLPAMLEELHSQHFYLPQNLLKKFKPYEELGIKKKQLILEYQTQYGFDKPASWWFNLEMLGGHALTDNTNLHFSEHMLSSNGSVAASPAATAYLLAALRYRGKDLPQAFQYLQQTLKANSQADSLPNVFPIDEFELAFSANYFLEAGMSINDPLLQPLIKKVTKRWQQRHETGIGYSSHFFIDPDCSATAIRVLNAAGYKNIDPDILLNFFNGSHIETYQGELSPSVSANLHTVSALSLLPRTDRIDHAIQKILSWLEQQANTEGPIFTDKWHFSPIYPIARAVISLIDLHKDLALRCVNHLLNSQHENGGWGFYNIATAEETAFASLALCYWHKKAGKVSSSTLIKAKKFLLTESNFSPAALWIGKVLYCPTMVVTAAVTAATLALSMNPEVKQLDQACCFKPLLKILLPIATSHEIIEIPEVTKHNQNWAVQLGLCNPEDKLLKINLAGGSASALRHVNFDDLKIYSDYSLLLLLLDDILDESWQIFSTSDELKLAFSFFLNNLTGKNSPGNILPANFIFPKFNAISNAFMNIRNRLIKKNLNLNYFVKSIKLLFNYFILEFEHRRSRKKLSISSYLDLRIIVGGMDTAAELAYLLKNIELNAPSRTNRLFIDAKKNAYQALIIINDLLSLTKEKLHNEGNNNYVLMIQNHHSCSLQKAYEITMKEYNRRINAFFITKSKLEKNKNGDPNIKKALQIIAEQVQAHLDWALSSKRYH